jgi:hypothetical protein
MNMKLIVLITSRLESGLSVALRWRELGAPGVTILDAHGIFSLETSVRAGAIELPPTVVSSMSSSLEYVARNMQRSSQIVLSVAPDDFIDRMLAAVEAERGAMTEPFDGICFTLDVERALGVTFHGR